MNSKQILDHWKESLELLKWPQLKLILLAGLNNFSRSAKLSLEFGGWLISFMTLPILHKIISDISFGIFILELIIMLFALNILIFIYILSCRASLERKDFAYFKLYFINAPGVLGLVFISIFFQALAPVLYLASFFFIDSDFTFHNFTKSIRNGINFLIHFPAIVVPFIFINGIVSVFFGFKTCTTIYSVAIVELILIILTFLQLSLLSIIYTKIKHTYPDLFIAK